MPNPHDGLTSNNRAIFRCGRNTGEGGARLDGASPSKDPAPTPANNGVIIDPVFSHGGVCHGEKLRSSASYGSGLVVQVNVVNAKHHILRERRMGQVPRSHPVAPIL